MEERRISTGASCFLIKDESLKQGWQSHIYDWLKAEGFITWGRKGTFNTDWIYTTKTAVVQWLPKKESGIKWPLEKEEIEEIDEEYDWLNE